jgi:hypothetical protein
MVLLLAAVLVLLRQADDQIAVAGTKLQAHGPDLVLSVPWGSGGSALGGLDGAEGASEGPMSFALAHNGDLVVLDQINERLARFDGAGNFVGELKIPAPTFQELEILDDGHVVLLDRLARAQLLVLDAGGNEVRAVDVVGAGIPEGGGVTGMFAEDDGIWLEFGHLQRVRLLDAKLAPCPRTVRRGRAHSASTEVLAGIDGHGGAQLWLEDEASGSILAQASVQTGQYLDRVIWVQTDASGDVHALFHLLELDPVDPRKVTFDGVLGVRFDHTLQEIASYRSSFTIQIWEQFREFRIAGDGTVYQMAFDDHGVRIIKWVWS